MDSKGAKVLGFDTAENEPANIYKKMTRVGKSASICRHLPTLEVALEITGLASPGGGLGRGGRSADL